MSDSNELAWTNPVSLEPRRPDVADPASFSSWDDLALAYAVQRRNERALATLYDRHAPAMLGLILRIVPEPAEAESVLLETFAQAWRSADRYSPERGPVVVWLATMARSRALDFARATKRRARLVPMSMDDAPPESLAARDSSSDPAAAAEHRERTERLATALAQLPDAQRAAIELAFYEGLSHTDVAAKLGEPLGTIKTRIRLGMTKLRSVLTEELAPTRRRRDGEAFT